MSQSWSTFVSRAATVILLGSLALLGAAAVSPGRWLGAPNAATLSRAQVASPKSDDRRRDAAAFVQRLARVAVCQEMWNVVSRAMRQGPVIVRRTLDGMNEVGKIRHGTTTLWTNAITGRNTCGAMVEVATDAFDATWFADQVWPWLVSAARGAAQSCIHLPEEALQRFGEFDQLTEHISEQRFEGTMAPRSWPLVVAPQDIDGTGERLEALTNGAFGRCMRALEMRKE